MIRLDSQNTNYIIINDESLIPYKIKLTRVADKSVTYEYLTYQISGKKYIIEYELPSMVGGEYIFEIMTECDVLIYKNLASTDYINDPESQLNDKEITFII